MHRLHLFSMDFHEPSFAFRQVHCISSPAVIVTVNNKMENFLSRFSYADTNYKNRGKSTLTGLQVNAFITPTVSVLFV